MRRVSTVLAPVVLPIALALLASCAPAAAPGGGAVARFTLPASGPIDYGDVPFPSDLYRDAAGAITIGALPSSRTDDPFFVSLRAMLGARGGFCTTCSIHFYLDGELDPASVPASRAPSDAAAASDAIVLLDLDASAPRLVPLRVWYDPTLDHLAIRPVRGVTLGSHHRWIAALTSQLRAMDGAPLRASDAFAAIRDGRDTTHPDLSHAIDVLVMAGVPRASLAVATTFTTEESGRTLAALRTALHAAPLGTITVDRVYGAGTGASGTLDELFGVPAEDRPGVDVPSMTGADGSNAMIHEAIGTVILGHFTAPRVVEGAGTDVGVPLEDAAGMPAAGALEDVPFVLAIPAGLASLASVPVLFVHHGFNASRVTALTMADTAARAGWATFGIDAFQHGARAEGAMDVQHNLRGSMGADGLAETSVASVSARTFGIVGPPAGMALYPGYPLGAFTQFAADVMSSVRLLREGDLAPIVAAEPTLAGLSFDRARIGYLGISMGSVIGASIVAAEPDVRAAVLVVPPGSIVESLCEGVAFRGLTTGTLANLLRIDGRFDEVTHACVGDPIVDLVRWSLEPIDPLALAPRFFEAPLDPSSPRPDVVWVMSANDEVASPPATESMLAAAGVPGVGTFASAPVAPITLPASANLSANGTSVTALAVRLAPASHGLCEVQGADENYALPIEPPFMPLASPVHYENPIADTHARIAAFLGTMGGAARGSFR